MAFLRLDLGRGQPDLFTARVGLLTQFLHRTDALAAPGPRVFVYHGRSDPVLPFGSTVRAVVEHFHNLGVETAFHQFEGSHEMPPAVIDAAIAFWLDGCGK
jgi:predicted esterase